jgi:PAS domain S-box-containing protein
MALRTDAAQALGRRALSYGVSVAAVGGAFLVRHVLSLAIGPGLPPFILFYPTVMIVALLAGMGPGWAAGVLASLVTWYAIMPPQGSFHLSRLSDVFSLALFFCMGIFMSVVAELYRRARRTAAAYQQELSTRESESKFSGFFHGSPVCMSISRLSDGKYIDVNQAFLEVFGFSRGQVIGRGSLELGLWDASEDREKTVSLLRAEGRVRNFQTRFRTGSGGIWTGLLSAELIDVAGEPCVCTLTQDITERIRAEEAVKESEKRYRSTLDNMLEGCQIVGTDWRYLYVNGMAATHGHSTREQLVGRTMMGAYPGIQDTDLFKNLERCMRDRVVMHIENNFSFANGVSEWFDLSIQPVPEGLLVLSYDITERKRAEEALQALNSDLERRVRERTTELEAANQELEAFAYAVSHDLRAPLRALSGFSNALQEDYGTALSGEAHEFLDQICLASASMGELIEGLLRLSRSTRGELLRKEVDLSGMAMRILTDHARADPGRQVSWTVQPGLSARGDPRLIEVVLTNLVDNAWKYTGRTAHSDIRFLGETRKGQRVFSLADNGAGFDEKHAARLFKPFQRLHRRDEFPGIGIGLATVYRIVNRHGGAITASGVPGGGATFSFSLEPPATGGKEGP